MILRWGCQHAGVAGASAPALQPTSAPVDHASRTGWGADSAADGAERARLEGELASGRAPRRSARLTSGSRRPGRGLVVWRGSRAEGGPGGKPADGMGATSRTVRGDSRRRGEADG